MKIIRDIEQGSDEWLNLRLGKITASKLADVMSKGRGNAPSKTRETYMLQLAAEILTGAPVETFKSSAMEWGNLCEPQARAMYEFETGYDVEEVAFVEVSDVFGVSPDGLVGSRGLVEIKSPNTTTQIKRYLAGKFPAAYKAQVQGQLYATEREWCDFVSFDPRITGAAQYFCVRVERDEEYILEIQKAISAFSYELLQMIEALK